MRRKEGRNQELIKSKKQKFSKRDTTLENYMDKIFWDFSKSKRNQYKQTVYYVMSYELGCIDHRNKKFPKRDIIIGREIYNDVFDTIKGFEGKVLLIQGKPGIGKSSFGLFFILEKIYSFSQDNVDYNIAYTNKKTIYVIFTSYEIEYDGTKSTKFNFQGIEYYVFIYSTEENGGDIPLKIFKSKSNLYMIIDPASKEHFADTLNSNDDFKKMYVASERRINEKAFSTSETVEHHLPEWSKEEFDQLLAIYGQEKRVIDDVFAKESIEQGIEVLDPDKSTPLEEFKKAEVTWAFKLFSENDTGFERVEGKLLSYVKPFLQEWFKRMVDGFRVDVSKDKNGWKSFVEAYRGRKVIVSEFGALKHIVDFHNRICPGVLRFMFAGASSGGLIIKLSRAITVLGENLSQTAGRFRSIQGSELHSLLYDVMDAKQRIGKALEAAVGQPLTLEDYYATIFQVSKYKQSMYKLHYQEFKAEKENSKDAGQFFTDAEYRETLENSISSRGTYYHLKRSYPVIDGYGYALDNDDEEIVLFQVTTASKRKNIDPSALETILTDIGFDNGVINFFFAVHVKVVLETFTFPVSLRALAQAQERNKIIREFLEHNSIREDVFYDAAAEAKKIRDGAAGTNKIWTDFESYVLGEGSAPYKNKKGLLTYYGTRMSDKWGPVWTLKLYKLHAEETKLNR